MNVGSSLLWRNGATTAWKKSGSLCFRNKLSSWHAYLVYLQGRREGSAATTYTGHGACRLVTEMAEHQTKSTVVTDKSYVHRTRVDGEGTAGLSRMTRRGADTYPTRGARPIINPRPGHKTLRSQVRTRTGAQHTHG